MLLTRGLSVRDPHWPPSRPALLLLPLIVASPTLARRRRLWRRPQSPRPAANQAVLIRPWPCDVAQWGHLAIGLRYSWVSGQHNEQAGWTKQGHYVTRKPGLQDTWATVHTLAANQGLSLCCFFMSAWVIPGLHLDTYRITTATLGLVLIKPLALWHFYIYRKYILITPYKICIK